MAYVQTRWITVFYDLDIADEDARYDALRDVEKAIEKKLPAQRYDRDDNMVWELCSADIEYVNDRPMLPLSVEVHTSEAYRFNDIVTELVNALKEVRPDVIIVKAELQEEVVNTQILQLRLP